MKERENKGSWAAGLILLLLGFAAAIPAWSDSTGRTVAVLEFNGANDSALSQGERGQLIQTLRRIARRNLPKSDGWDILNQDNIAARTPPDLDVSSCDDEGCILSAGRKLQVDYIVSESVGQMGSHLQVYISLYKVAGGEPRGTAWFRGRTADDLIDSLESSSGQLFAALGGYSSVSSSGTRPPSRTVIVQSFPPEPQVVVYRRRPVYYNPVACVLVPLLFLLFFIPVVSYHNGYR